ncbi:MAG: hypothetical protein WEG56_04460 [Chloroflexota bacterium]
MRLEGRSRQILELHVVGYEFQGVAGRALLALGKLGVLRALGFDHDANWLMVQGHASDGEREWDFRAPCMLTTEAAELAEWLEEAARGSQDLGPTDFTEPNLEFRRTSAPPDPPVVRVTFRLEARPPWAPDITQDEWDGVWLEFETSPDDLRNAAAQLRAALDKYPRH